MAGYIELTTTDLLISTMLVVIAGGISVALRLGLVKSLAIAAVRCVAQLGMIGLILKYIFTLQSPLLVIGWLLVMLFFASREVVRRSKHGYDGLRMDAFLTMSIAAITVGSIVTQAVIKVIPWYDPQYLIPVFGMIFGNSLNGISLALDRFLEHLKSRRQEVELLLAFGATRSEALEQAARESVRTGMMPIINNMSVAGIVSLPGIMTGQIVAGVSPLQAVTYQIVIMFMISASCAIGSMTILWLAGRKMLGDFGLKI